MAIKGVIFVFIISLFVCYFFFVTNKQNFSKFHKPGYKTCCRNNKKKENSSKKTCDLNHLKKIVLAINYNFPHYSSVPLLTKFYKPAFGELIFCGSNSSDAKYYNIIVITENKGYQGYECLLKAMQLYPSFQGFIHSSDDVVINWWNMINYDLDKIWIGENKFINYSMGTPVPKDWYWWTAVNAARLCEEAFKEIISLNSSKAGVNIEKYRRRYYKNTNKMDLCFHTWSDFLYIPARYKDIYSKLLEINLRHDVFLEVAIPTSLMFLLSDGNYINLNGSYFNGQYGYSATYLSGEAFYETYKFSLNFSHPFKFEKGMKNANINIFQNVIQRYSNLFIKFCTK